MSLAALVNVTAYRYHIQTTVIAVVVSTVLGETGVQAAAQVSES